MEESRRVWNYPVAFAIAVAAVNLGTVGCLALARVEIDRAMVPGPDGEIVEMNMSQVNPAIIAMSIAAAVDGALLSLLFMTDASALIARRRHEIRERELEASRLKANAEVERDLSEERIAERAVADKELYSKLASEEFKARMRTLLQQWSDTL